MKKKSRIERRNEWRLEYRKEKTPWVSTVDPRYEPVEAKGKAYEEKGKQEAARRRRQAGDHYNPEWIEQMGA